MGLPQWKPDFPKPTVLGIFYYLFKDDIKWSNATSGLGLPLLWGSSLFFTDSFFSFLAFMEVTDFGKVFATCYFCTGGFLFSFGGLVPSWDSSYYKLMMPEHSIIEIFCWVNGGWWRL
jgi:hypothetical protein